jgi:predicted CopG family antitoxin
MKTITIRDDTYHSLLILKEGEDSFSDVINRLVSKKNRDIREYAGALRDSKVLDRLHASPERCVIPEGRDSDRSRHIVPD